MNKKQTENQNRNWYLLDAKDKILGKLATSVADLLRGKNKPYFDPSRDLGDFVVIVDASQIRVTGKKLGEKIYFRHSGYPGGLKRESLKDMILRKPEEVLRKAVSGMLPRNKLKKIWLSRLFIYPGSEHPYKDKFTMKNERIKNG